MLPLLKKKSDASARAESSAWHPNFRNFRALPDTKVVRTAFVLNGVFVAVAAVLVVWSCYRIYQWRGLEAQIAQWQQQIDRDRGPSAQAIAQYKKFQEERAKIDEVDAFVSSRPVLSDLLIHLGNTVPAYLAIDRVELATATMTLRGTVRGAPDQASGRASSYLQQLKSDAFFTNRFSEINLVSLNRDPKSGGMVVEIALKLK
jgi:hypothetical protein